MTPYEFIHELSWRDIPLDVQRQLRRCLLDTIASAVGGRRMKLSEIIYDFTASVYAGKGSHLWLDGREVSPAGAALAHGMMIDALDIHDNFNQAKGHAGVAIVPTAFAVLDMKSDNDLSGKELLTTLAVGYEVALRAGLVLHATACDYHSSGAWNSLGCAAITARRLGLKRESTSHAMGIAEYHGPRSQMMRCIDHPTMLKDGSGWGAMVGVVAGQLAQRGFTGAPAITVEAPEIKQVWDDLGVRWYLMEQDFKRHAVCHWAQPAIYGTLQLVRANHIEVRDIAHIQVSSFHEATRLTCRRPTTTEEAQYSLPFPVSAALIFGNLGPNELSGKALEDQRVLELADRIDISEDDTCNDKFPGIQMAKVSITTTDGNVYRTQAVESPWDQSDMVQPEKPPDQELLEKFRWLVSETLPSSRATELEQSIWQCAELSDVHKISNLMTSTVADNS